MPSIHRHNFMNCMVILCFKQSFMKSLIINNCVEPKTKGGSSRLARLDGQLFLIFFPFYFPLSLLFIFIFALFTFFPRFCGEKHPFLFTLDWRGGFISLDWPQKASFPRFCGEKHHYSRLTAKANFSPVLRGKSSFLSWFNGQFIALV